MKLCAMNGGRESHNPMEDTHISHAPALVDAKSARAGKKTNPPTGKGGVGSSSSLIAVATRGDFCDDPYPTKAQAAKDLARAKRKALRFDGDITAIGRDKVAKAIRVIHGYGAQGEGGVIRDRLRAFCDTFGDCLEYERGEASLDQRIGDRLGSGGLPGSCDWKVGSR